MPGRPSPEPGRRSWRRAVLSYLAGALVFGAGPGLKLAYSGAAADEPRWLLASTAHAFTLVGGPVFGFEPGAGYVSADGRLLLYRGCSGLNFLAMCLLLVALAPLRSGFRGPGRSGPGARAGPDATLPLLYYPAAALLALPLTVLANVGRLQVLLGAARLRPEILHPGAAHLAIGSFVYLFFLILFFCALRLSITYAAARISEASRTP